MRKHITRILSALLAVVLLAGALEITTVRANDFSDIPKGHWAESYITRAFNEGVIAGTAYDRTTGARDFSPLTPMTYAQFATILSRKYYADEYAALCETYAGENWAKPADELFREKGLHVSGVTQAKYDAAVTRYDMAQLMANVILDLGGSALSAEDQRNIGYRIGDWSAVPERYRAAVALVYGLGVITGRDESGSFAGEQTMTRAEGATVYCRLSDKVAPGAIAAPTVTAGNGKVGDFDVTFGDGWAQPGYDCFSTDVWTGEQYDRCFGFIVGDRQEMDAAIASVMGKYPSVICLFSYGDAEFLHELHRGAYDYFRQYKHVVNAMTRLATPRTPSGKGVVTNGNYTELRIDFTYLDIDILVQYLHGVIPSLPTTGDANWEKPADYSLLLNAKSEIERTYDISARSRDFDKVYAIYHYLTQNFTYDYGLLRRGGATRSEAINAFNHPAGENYLLTNRMGICANFAMTFDSLCKIFDLESEFVSGDVTFASDGHAWDIVKVDGTWYWVDSTWDEHGVRTVDRWQYFLVNDAKMAEQHIWTRSDYPVCAHYYDTSKENMPSYTSNEQLPTGGTEYFQAPVSTRTRASDYTLELSIGETYEITEADPFYEQYMANVSNLRSEVRGTNTSGVSTRYKKFIAESACDIYMTYHFSSGDYTLHIIVK